jgi:hypothetical protein
MMVTKVAKLEQNRGDLTRIADPFFALPAAAVLVAHADTQESFAGPL